MSSLPPVREPNKAHETPVSREERIAHAIDDASLILAQPRLGAPPASALSLVAHDTFQPQNTASVPITAQSSNIPAPLQTERQQPLQATVGNPRVPPSLDDANLVENEPRLSSNISAARNPVRRVTWDPDLITGPTRRIGPPQQPAIRLPAQGQVANAAVPPAHERTAAEQCCENIAVGTLGLALIAAGPGLMVSAKVALTAGLVSEKSAFAMYAVGGIITLAELCVLGRGQNVSNCPIGDCCTI